MCGDIGVRDLMHQLHIIENTSLTAGACLRMTSTLCPTQRRMVAHACCLCTWMVRREHTAIHTIVLCYTTAHPTATDTQVFGMLVLLHCMTVTHWCQAVSCNGRLRLRHSSDHCCTLQRHRRRESRPTSHRHSTSSCLTSGAGVCP